MVVVFGERSVYARLEPPERWWGVCRLPRADMVKHSGLRLEPNGGWNARQAGAPAKRWAALHRCLRSQDLSAATRPLVLRSRITPCMSYGPELWRPAKHGANMTVAPTRAAKLISGIHREASNTPFFKDRSVSQDVMRADLDILSADDHCCIVHGPSVYAAGRFRGRRGAIRTRAHCANDPCSPET